MNNKIKTLKELKSSGYKALGIKDEMKKNLKLNLRPADLEPNIYYEITKLFEEK